MCSYLCGDREKEREMTRGGDVVSSGNGLGCMKLRAEVRFIKVLVLIPYIVYIDSYFAKACCK
jgi:hypothetical protein